MSSKHTISDPHQMQSMEVFTLSIKSEIEELRKLQENGKPGYACGWTDACGMVFSVVDKAKDRLKCCIMNNNACIITASTLENIIEEVFENGQQHRDSL